MTSEWRRRWDAFRAAAAAARLAGPVAEDQDDVDDEEVDADLEAGIELAEGTVTEETGDGGSEG